MKYVPSKHLSVSQKALHNKESLSPDVSSAEAEKFCPRLILGSGGRTGNTESASFMHLFKVVLTSRFSSWKNSPDQESI